MTKISQPHKLAVVCANGIGDALMSMVLSHNAELAGYRVDTYSNLLCELKEWFPGKSILPFPHGEMDAFEHYEWVLGSDHSIVAYNPPSIKKFYLFTEDQFDKNRTIVDNYLSFCRDQLLIEDPVRSNGITPPPNLIFQKYRRQVILHPESDEEKRNWGAQKFIKLAKKLQKKGYQPLLCVSPKQRPKWDRLLGDDAMLPITPTLGEVAKVIYESNGLIGNNSGLGHLASCLGQKPLSLFARKSYARLWRPGFTKGEVVTPLPLLFGASLKHRFWSKALPTSRVLKTFERIDGEGER